MWQRLSVLGDVHVFEASRLNPKMKDIVRIRGPGVRVEGARDGELVVVFLDQRARSSRRRVEALLAP